MIVAEEIFWLIYWSWRLEEASGISQWRKSKKTPPHPLGVLLSNFVIFHLVWLSSGQVPGSTCPDAILLHVAWHVESMCKVWKSTAIPSLSYFNPQFLALFRVLSQQLLFLHIPFYKFPTLLLFSRAFKNIIGIMGVTKEVRQKEWVRPLRTVMKNVRTVPMEDYLFSSTLPV